MPLFHGLEPEIEPAHEEQQCRSNYAEPRAQICGLRIVLGRYWRKIAPGEPALYSAVSHIDDESQVEPRREAEPRCRRQEVDQIETGDDSENWNDQPSRNSERAFAPRILDPKDDYSSADQYEREQSSDVGQIDHLVYARESCEYRHEHSSQDGRYVRRAKLRMNLAEERRQQS